MITITRSELQAIKETLEETLEYAPSEDSVRESIDIIDGYLGTDQDVFEVVAISRLKAEEYTA